MLNKKVNAFPHAILLIFHTPHFPYSSFSTLRIFHTPHFPYSSFSIVRTFHTPHFPYSALRTPHSALRTPHSALRTPRFPFNLFVQVLVVLCSGHIYQHLLNASYKFFCVGFFKSRHFRAFSTCLTCLRIAKI